MERKKRNETNVGRGGLVDSSYEYIWGARSTEEFPEENVKYFITEVYMNWNCFFRLYDIFIPICFQSPQFYKDDLAPAAQRRLQIDVDRQSGLIINRTDEGQ